MAQGRPTKTPDGITVSIRIPAPLLQALRTTARQRAVREDKDISANDLMKTAVMSYYGDLLK